MNNCYQQSPSLALMATQHFIKKRKLREIKLFIRFYNILSFIMILYPSMRNPSNILPLPSYLQTPSDQVLPFAYYFLWFFFDHINLSLNEYMTWFSPFWHQMPKTWHSGCYLFIWNFIQANLILDIGFHINERSSCGLKYENVEKKTRCE